MKLIIQIPCYNEEKTLPETIAALPRRVDGFDVVEFLIIDDGSSDRTAEVGAELGVDHIVRLRYNRGLAYAYMQGLAACVENCADVIVNTDADNQYNAEGIPDLVRPILEGRADLVIGARPIASIAHFSLAKRLLQKIGSGVVRVLSNTDVQDAPSGFRAISRDAAMRLNVFNSYTYTLETIIQAGLSNLRIVSVPIEINPPTRSSRLMRNTTGYIYRSVLAMTSAFFIYQPTKFFGSVSATFMSGATILSIRYLYFMMIGEGAGHIQSVILAGVFAISGIFMAAIGIVAHLLAINRRLLEELRYRERASRPRRESR